MGGGGGGGGGGGEGRESKEAYAKVIATFLRKKTVWVAGREWGRDQGSESGEES